MRETIVKRLVGFSGLVFTLGLLGTFFDGVRELAAALVIFSVGFAAFFLIAIALFLLHHVIDRMPEWFERRAPQWNRASQDWVSALFRREQTPVLVAVSVQPGVEQLNRRAAFARQE